MLKISSRRYGEDVEVMQVTEETGALWSFEPEEPFHGYGAGKEHVWVGDRAGTIRIYHGPTRSKCAEVTIPRTSTEWHPTSVSRDGRRLLCFAPVDADETSTLHVVDLSTGQIVARHAGIPGFLSAYPVERPDGRLLINSVKRPGFAGITIITLDPETGDRNVEALGQGRGLDRVIPSPDGRYLLRKDLTRLPRKSARVSGRSIFGFGRRDAEPDEHHYGLTWQIWEASPLRFVRRVVVGWLKPEEMRDAFRFESHYPPAEAILQKRRMWDVISAVMEAANAPPDGGPPPRSLFPRDLAEDDDIWRLIEENFEKLADQSSSFKGWQADGEAFWVDTNGYLSCIGVDGSSSPRLYLQRLGLNPRTIPLCAVSPGPVSPLPGRQARVQYDQGTALFDGAAGPEIVRAIPADGDGWCPKPPPPPPDPRGNAIVVPLAGWSNSAVVRAVQDLTAEVVPELANRAADGEIRLVFKLGDAEIAEQVFFDRVACDFPDAAPALGQLVERCVDASLRGAFLFSNAEEGTGFLIHAVRALGLIDAAALPIVQAYGRVVDREHEYAFAGEVVPALIQAHGWTDAMIEFAFWIMVRNYYNTLQDFSLIWIEWGLRDAIINRDPEILARRIVSLHRRDLKTGKFAVGRRKGGLTQLAADIAKPHEPWLEAFLAEAKRGLAS